MKIIETYKDVEIIEMGGAKFIRLDAENWMIGIEPDDVTPYLRYMRIRKPEYAERKYQERLK